MSAFRLALLSDIHGNLLALRAVLRDLDALGTDLVACLGDVATLGPEPLATIALVQERCAVRLLGNHDEYLLSHERTDHHLAAPPVRASVERTRSLLGEPEREALRGYEASARFDLGPAGAVQLFHGSPASNLRDLLAETPEAELDAELPGDAAVFAGGHTHLPLARRHRERLLLNPGSVGLPFERFLHGGPPTVLPFAEYAVLELRGRSWSASLRRVELDREALLRALSGWRDPLAESLARGYASAR